MKNLSIILFACLLSFQFVNAQAVSVHQYRKVEQKDMQEYLKRETTYWSKLAESEVKKGNLTFWAIFQRVGGENQAHSPNILIINTFNNLDKSNEIWSGVTDLFPDVKIEDMQTWEISTTTSTIYLRDLNNHIQGENVDPEKDFNFVNIIYHNSKDTGKHLAFESEKWKPMLQKAMNEGKTTMKGWGNSIIVLPESDRFPYGSASYDLFSSMHEALSPRFSDDMEIPDGFFDDIGGNYDGPRNSQLYRVIKVVSAPNDSN